MLCNTRYICGFIKPAYMIAMHMSIVVHHHIRRYIILFNCDYASILFFFQRFERLLFHKMPNTEILLQTAAATDTGLKAALSGLYYKVAR
jgi:hypothetical protein